MPSTRIRPVHRSDRADLTRLVNAHVATILPGAQLSTQRILAQLEAEPEETITDRWVDDRRCLVAETDGRVVAAMLAVHYAGDLATSDSLRGRTCLRWLVGEPRRPQALDDLLSAAADVAVALGSGRLSYDGVLPVPGCYGLPDSWPHIGLALDRAGFDGGTDDLQTVAKTPVAVPDAPQARRSLGDCGTRFTIVDAAGEAGSIEIEAEDADRSAFPGSGRYMVIGNLWARSQGADKIRAQLLAVAEDWSARAGAALLIVDLESGQASMLPGWHEHGFETVGSCRRGRTKALG